MPVAAPRWTVDAHKLKGVRAGLWPLFSSHRMGHYLGTEAGVEAAEGQREEVHQLQDALPVAQVPARGRRLFSTSTDCKRVQQHQKCWD